MRAVAPSICINVEFTRDPFYVWDGDGPAPDMMDAYDTDYTATAIANGKEIVGRDSLCGSYYDVGECDWDSNGYTPQKLLEAVSELRRQLPVDASNLLTQCEMLHLFLTALMNARHDQQMHERKELV